MTAACPVEFPALDAILCATPVAATAAAAGAADAFLDILAAVPASADDHSAGDMCTARPEPQASGPSDKPDSGLLQAIAALFVAIPTPTPDPHPLTLSLSVLTGSAPVPEAGRSGTQALNQRQSPVQPNPDIVAGELAFRLVLKEDSNPKPAAPSDAGLITERKPDATRPLIPQATVPSTGPAMQLESARQNVGDPTARVANGESIKTTAPASADTGSRDDSQRDNRTTRPPALELPKETALRTPSPHESVPDMRAVIAGPVIERQPRFDTPPRTPVLSREPSRPTEYEVKTPAPTTTSVRQVQIRLGEPSRPIDLRVWERAGTVQVSVRSADLALTAPLRSELPSLMTNLERTGYRGEAHLHHLGTDAATEMPVPAAALSDNSWTPEQHDPNRRDQPDEHMTARKSKHGEAEAFTLDLAGETYDD